MFRCILLILVLAATAANAQGVGHDSRSQQRAEQANPKPQRSPQPSELMAVKDQIERIARAIETANNKKPSQEEKDESRRNLEAQEKISAWAPRVFWAAFAELIVTAAGVIVIWLTLTETRRIGQAQVRAYVDIESIFVTFRTDWVPSQFHPQVEIVAKNSGQSPARGFVWRPTLQYFAGDSRRERGMQGNWVGQPGETISAGGPFSGRVLIGDMGIDQFYQSSGAAGEAALVRVRIEFEYVDVFGTRITDEAYAAGTADRVRDLSGPIWSAPQMTSEPRFRDWDDTTDYRNQ
jgi:hypothetical protein